MIVKMTILRLLGSSDDKETVIRRASVSRGRRRLCRTTLHDRVYSGVCIPLALTSLLIVLRFRIYSILRTFTFLVYLIRVG